MKVLYKTPSEQTAKAWFDGLLASVNGDKEKSLGRVRVIEIVNDTWRRTLDGQLLEYRSSTSYAVVVGEEAEQQTLEGFGNDGESNRQCNEDSEER